jgi:MYXO-CTERM domain-containing protein
LVVEEGAVTTGEEGHRVGGLLLLLLLLLLLTLPLLPLPLLLVLDVRGRCDCTGEEDEEGEEVVLLLTGSRVTSERGTARLAST